MRPPPLRKRVVSALDLAPMTVGCLARALSVSREAVRKQVVLAEADGRVVKVGVVQRDNGRWPMVYRAVPQNGHIGAITDSPSELARRIAKRVTWRNLREGQHTCIVYVEDGLVYVSSADCPAVRAVPAEAIIGSYTTTADPDAIREDLTAMQQVMEQS